MQRTFYHSLLGTPNYYRPYHLIYTSKWLDKTNLTINGGIEPPLIVEKGLPKHL